MNTGAAKAMGLEAGTGQACPRHTEPGRPPRSGTGGDACITIRRNDQ